MILSVHKLNMKCNWVEIHKLEVNVYTYQNTASVLDISHYCSTNCYFHKSNLEVVSTLEYWVTIVFNYRNITHQAIYGQIMQPLKHKKSESVAASDTLVFMKPAEVVSASPPV